MESMVERACGLDVHKETVVACVIGEEIKKEIKTFRTMTSDLLNLKEWLKSKKITHVAIESTGIYWKPVFNILEDSFEVLLVNARHIKNVPGRKTDVKDSEWLCKLLRNGLIRGSFIPPIDIRDLRDLTRYRKKLIDNITAEKNRIQKVLEDANIKLTSVVSDSFGVSASKIIEELVKGELTVEEMSQLAKGKLRKKITSLKEALLGNFKEHHKFMIKTSLDHIKSLEKLIKGIDKEIDKLLEKYSQEYELLQTIPGVKKIGAASIIAEIGTNMDKFSTEEHISSWAGMSPGNNESAGKKKHAAITHGNKSLKSMLTECAWAATKSKDTYLKAKYHSMVGRKGKKRSLITIAHKILVICYYILKYKEPYKELGIDYFDKKKKEKVINGYIKKLNNLGYCVTLNNAA